jgi:NAD(P)-dependent dehydrogenase (short-subunit alcohol dehydrogenase family)
MMERWTAADMPTQAGRLAVVTGTGGLGLETALQLARAGAEVVVAGRSAQKGAAALARIRSEVANAAVRFEKLDLADLRSVADFAKRLSEDQDRLDLLVNNAGVMVPPERRETADGFELQLGTNYLSHFALTGHLLPLLRRGKDARVVTVSSIAAPSGRIDFDDLNAERSYKSMPVYAQSKLACLMFALELQRWSDAAGWGLKSIAAHPGVSRTDLLHNAPGRYSIHRLIRTYLPFMFQPVSQGALPSLFAATAPEARPGAYYGPDRMGGTRGHPTMAKIPPQALDEAASARLWQMSEGLTGVRYADHIASAPRVATAA